MTPTQQKVHAAALARLENPNDETDIALEKALLDAGYLDSDEQVDTFCNIEEDRSVLVVTVADRRFFVNTEV